METIVSLVPSVTELVYRLGAGERLVGRTRFCVEPAGQVDRVPALGGTKDPDVAAIVALRPSLVIANREENRREDVERLQAAGIEVLVTDPDSVEGAATMVEQVGIRLHRPAAAGGLAAEIRREAASVPGAHIRVFVAAWWRPLMALGGDTYASDLLRCAGGENVTAHLERYPRVELEELEALQPHLILLPDEPFLFRERHRPAFERYAPARIVDGKLLWWHGPRTPGALRTLREQFAQALAPSRPRSAQ